MNPQTPSLPESLEKMVFAVLPLNGFLFNEPILTIEGLNDARAIGTELEVDPGICGVEVLSSDTPTFVAFGSVIASHCPTKLVADGCPHQAFSSKILVNLLPSENEVGHAREEFLINLFTGLSGEIKTLVLVLNEALSLALPKTLCALAGIDSNSIDHLLTTSVLGASKHYGIVVDLKAKEVRIKLKPDEMK